MAINFTALLMGIFMNPGINQSIIDIKLKEQLGKGDDSIDE